MPAWRRTKLVPGLYDEPVSEHLQREREKDGGRTEAFRYLGPVRAASWSGERPMTVEWEMRFPMPVALVASGRVAG